MDLTLLPHLSDDALRAEADRRGLDVSGLDRAGIIDAIREAEAVAVTAPPPAPDAYAPTWPPRAKGEPPRGGGGKLGTARALLGRFVSIAKSALDRKEGAPATSADEGPGEPIATRTMAELLVRQGHLDRARGILAQLARERPTDDAVRDLLRDVDAQLTDRALRRRLDRASGGAAFVEIVRTGTGCGVIWRIDESTRDRAAALLGGPGALTLRVIAVSVGPDQAVDSRQTDRGPVDAHGFHRLDDAASARLVVSVGLSDGETFVSALHAAS